MSEHPSGPERIIHDLLKSYKQCDIFLEEAGNAMQRYDKFDQRNLELDKEMDILVQRGFALKDLAINMGFEVDEEQFASLQRKFIEAKTAKDLVEKRKEKIPYDILLDLIAEAKEAKENIKMRLIENGMPEAEIN
jgi:hypothetical protein